MRRAPCPAGLVLLAECHLLCAEPLFTVNGGPTGCGVAAVQELLVYAFMATTTVAGGQMGTNDKAVVILFLLAFWLAGGSPGS
jgi:hypothetical protein